MIAKYLKGRSKYLVICLIIVSIINIYLFAIDVFKNKYAELIYLDFLVLFITIVFFVMDYISFRNSYKSLYNCIENNGEVDSYLVEGQSFEENLMRTIIEDLKTKNNNDIEIYKQSLKELDEYMAKWVHEIKIPISSLSIITDRLSNIEDSIDIKNQVAKINFLVNSILYSSRSNTMFEDVFINRVKLEKLVKMAIKNNSFLLIKNNIEVSLNKLDYDVYTDSKCMSYILDQIINNAIKYSKEVGKIEFDSRKLENGVVLSIKDFGIGINEEDVSRVFDKGFTGSNGRNQLYKSTGMGLYFVKKMIDNLGHDIEVCSENGSYTIFNIYFYNISDYLSPDNQVISLSNCYQIDISLDGTEETHDNLRIFENGVGSHNLVFKNANLLLDNSIQIRVINTFDSRSVSNLYNDIKFMIDFRNKSNTYSKK